ncbi:MAG: sulfur carrier protein ThiS [Eubacteriaceae bacterium]|jgi:sulfur carrier protein
MVNVNGTGKAVAGQTVSQLLESSSYDPARVAVECNGEIVPKARYSETVLKDGDSLEVVSFVGGG